jgi:type VI secretion system (T6SS) effector TldE1-like protein
MWKYEQSTGRLFDDGGALVATGYSGFGADKNQPADESVANLGPIPAGQYSIGAPESVNVSGPHGPYVLRLMPASTNNMFGRDGFLIHGDSVEHPGTASHGCIIMPRAIREAIAQSDDHELNVVAGEAVTA